MKVYKISQVILLFVAFVVIKVEAQTIERLDRDRGPGGNVKVGQNVEEAFYTSHFEAQAEYLIFNPKYQTLKEFLGCPIKAVHYYHEAFMIEKIVVYVDARCDLLLRKKLYGLYGKPTRFANEKGVETSVWRAKSTELYAVFIPAAEFESTETPASLAGHITLTFTLSPDERAKIITSR